MFYYFFLNSQSDHLKSCINIVNHAPHSLSDSNLSNLHINYFYSNGEKWKFNYFGEIKKNELININKDDLGIKVKDKSIFICLSEKKNIDDDYLQNSYKLEKIFHPPMRSNIKIFNNYSAASYQGEIPAIFLKKKLSLVSCSPMIQKTKGIKNFFYLINLSNSPEIKEFKVEVLNIDKQKISELICKTNTVNFYDIEEINKTNDLVYIFKSSEYGGIPLYFSVNDDYTNMSIEHTHPPVEHVVFGDRPYFQRKKKTYWFEKN